MPTLTLKVAPLQTPARYRQLAQALTTLTAQLLGKRREVTAVIVEGLPVGHWYVGGDELRRPTALLEISITAGTNTADEKAAFVSAAFAELQRQLGEGGALEEASYVVVRELPAADWGYGGHTQQARKRTLAQAK